MYEAAQLSTLPTNKPMTGSCPYGETAAKQSTTQLEKKDKRNKKILEKKRKGGKKKRKRAASSDTETISGMPSEAEGHDSDDKEPVDTLKES